MTEQEILLVAGLAGLAVAITLGDLTLSAVRHWRRAALARGLRWEKGDFPKENGAEAGEESIDRRLLAIEAAGSDR